MAKRKTTASKKNDVKIPSIVAGLFAAAVILLLIFSKAKEEPGPLENSPVPAVRHESFVFKEKRTMAQPPAQAVSPGPEHIKAITAIPGSGGKIAFIIDDWGQTTANCKYLKEIPEPLAVSILPGLRHTKDVASCAARYHKVAMLHLPLEALHNSDFYPPDYVIKTTMDPALVSKIVDEDIDQLPTIEGVNNHMGSKATADRPLMRIIFKKIKRKGLFFVDSVTSRYTVSGELADEMGLPFGKRDVFLDNVNTRQAITKQIMALAQKARHRGYAVAIGHDRHLTMQVIEDEIPLLEEQGFKIVNIKDLLKKR